MHIAHVCEDFVKQIGFARNSVSRTLRAMKHFVVLSLGLLACSDSGGMGRTDARQADGRTSTVDGSTTRTDATTAPDANPADLVTLSFVFPDSTAGRVLVTRLSDHTEVAACNQTCDVTFAREPVLLSAANAGGTATLSACDGPACALVSPQTATITVALPKPAAMSSAMLLDAPVTSVGVFSNSDLALVAGSLQRRSLSGSVLWSVATIGSIVTTPDDDVVLLQGSTLQKYDGATGALLWTRTLTAGTPCGDGPRMGKRFSVGPSGRIAVQATTLLQVFDPDGNPLWQFNRTGLCHVVVGANDVVYSLQMSTVSDGLDAQQYSANGATGLLLADVCDQYHYAGAWNGSQLVDICSGHGDVFVDSGVSESLGVSAFVEVAMASDGRGYLYELDDNDVTSNNKSYRVGRSTIVDTVNPVTYNIGVETGSMRRLPLDIASRGNPLVVVGRIDHLLNDSVELDTLGYINVYTP